MDYDLSNPLSPPKHTRQWDWKKEAIKELKYQLPMFKEECDARCELVHGVDMVPDNYPLSKIDEILRDYAKGKFFAKIDITNAFFQTWKVYPDDMKWLSVWDCMNG